MKVHLVRHAQSERQLDTGKDLDARLTAVGRRQAEMLGLWLARERSAEETTAGVLCSSPLRRARETAKYVQTALGLELLTYDSLREADFHVAEDLPALHDGAVPPGYRPSERYTAFKEQARCALKNITRLADERDAPALAVSHGGLIKTVVRVITGSDAICLRLCNTGLTSLEWRAGRWHLIHVNLWDHLMPELRTW